MGWKDAEWAYSIDRPLAETAVLAALCMRTDDGTHETFVGQKTIAEMIGSSPEKVQRSLGVLERSGVITRSRRHGAGGYRTSDLIRVNVDTYHAERPQGETPTRQTSYQENRRRLPDDSSPPTRRKVSAEEITQIDHSVDHSDTLVALDEPTADPHEPVIDRFDEFYATWPRKVGKPNARKAWTKAIKTADPDQIIAAAVAYRDNPGVPAKQFIPHPATWLNRHGWDDDLEDRPTDRGRPTPTERAVGVMQSGRALIDQRQIPGLAPITTLNPKREMS